MAEAPLRTANFPIAIVGMSCRLPGADSPDAYWQLLKSQIDAVGTIPPQRWDIDFHYNPDPTRAGKMYSRAGGFLDDVNRFDAEFFGISPREAAQMDPQQRIALELSWEALESAGIVPRDIAGSDTSVVVGVSSNDYAVLQHEQGEASDPHMMSGGALSLVANRISYFFDLHGPSFSLDTACSSALVAVHQACETLRRGEASLALAGGINLLLSPWGGIGFSRARMLSPSGSCHSFDARADGYVRSEGGGIVVLKPLERAVADGDPIHAVIRGTGVNSDGRTIGVSMPNETAQQQLLRRVYENAGIDPADVDYVEAHGTGTGVGDPIECAAIGAVIGRAHRAGKPCLIGSAKTNIGHLESAAGIAGLLKVVMSLRHGEVPATINFEKPNPRIAFSDLNLAVADRHLPLSGGDRPLVMGVNSFGFGGTNAHAVIEEYRLPPPRTERAIDRTPSLLLLSAGSEAALKELAGRYARLLRDFSGDHLAICRAAARTRAHHPRRLAIIGHDAAELSTQLDDFADDKSEAPALSVPSGNVAQQARVVFVYSGNGAQWFGMGRDLFANEPLVREWVGRIDRILRPILGWSLVELFSSGGVAEDIYARTEIAQPALFALQVAIMEWLRAKGLVANAHLGHSVGEIAAAYAAGALSLDQASRLIAHRSLVQGKTAGMGRMAAAGISAAEAVTLIAPYGDAATIAAYNSPGNVTLAGDLAILSEIGAQLERDGAFYRPLTLNYAFHSPVMDPFRDEFLARLSDLAPSPCQSCFISTVTGEQCRGPELDANYWWDNVREPVRFADAINCAIGRGIEIFLEIGPNPILGYYLRECLQQNEAPGTALATLRRDRPEAESLARAVAACYVAGADIDVARLFPGRGPWHELPTYPWQGDRHAFSKRARPSSPSLGPKQHPLLGYRLPTAIPTWENTIEPWLLSYLGDHKVQGSTVFPAAGYLEMALAAGAFVHDTEALQVEGLKIQRPVVIVGTEPPRLELSFSSDDNGFRILAGNNINSNTAVVVTGRVLPLLSQLSRPSTASFAALRWNLPHHLDRRTHYRACAELGLDYGESFRGVAEIWFSSAEALARLDPPAVLAETASDYLLHPAILDAALQAVFACLAGPGKPEFETAYVPVAVERLRRYRATDGLRWCHATLRQRGDRDIVVDYLLADEVGAVALVQGVQLRRLDIPSALPVDTYHWVQRPMPRPRGDTEAIPLSLNAALAGAAAAADAGADTDASFVELLEDIAARYAMRCIDAISEGDAITIDALVGTRAVARQNVSFLRALLRLAERRRFIVATESGWLKTPQTESDPEQLWRLAISRHPDRFAALELAARCGDRLPRYLSAVGDTPLALAPTRDAELTDQLLETDQLFRTRNAAAADAAARFVDAFPPERTFRILEVGGGPAGLAAEIMTKLSQNRIEYVYCDSDQAAAERIAARFDDVAGFRAVCADLGGDDVIDGLEIDSVDLAVVGNGLFGATELHAALTAVRSYLKPGGRLLLVGSGSPDLLTYLFGMSRKWWNFIDIGVRPDSPLLGAREWGAQLSDAGFAEIEIVESSGADNSGWPQWSVVGSKPAAERRQPAAAPSGVWLVVGQSVPTATPSCAAEVARQLADYGATVVTVVIGDDDSDWAALTVPPGNRKACRALLGTVLESYGKPLHVVFCADAEPSTDVPEPAPGIERAFNLAVLVQAIGDLGAASLDLWIVTIGAMSAPGRSTPADPSQAMLWGLARTVMNERPELACHLIDLDPDMPSEEASREFVREVGQQPADGQRDDEILFMGTARFVNRVEHGMPLSAVRGSAGYRLVLDQRGGSDGLRLRSTEHAAIGPDQILIKVRAAGINFRDVLQRSGILPTEAFEGGFSGPTLGMEFAGEVVAVGAAGSRHRVGDAVYGFSPAAMSAFVCTDGFAVFPMPAGWHFEDAAGAPVAMSTVIYSLEHLARLGRGERILIHGAAGGVGLAGIQYAQFVGAEIFGTAGTPEKRDFLRRLGVPYVFDSRSLDFADEIRRITHGEGVDVILNSIAGEAIAKGISVLNRFGRFIELGKRDFFANTKLALEPFRRNIQFIGVDIDQMLIYQRELSGRIFERMIELTTNGTMRPVVTRAYPISRAAEAFRLVQQSRHIGKVVLGFPDEPPLVERAALEKLVLREDATYLVTGGLGGFGLATAERLAERGARQLVLVGRRRNGPDDAAARDSMQRIRARGANIVAAACDVADGVALDRLLVRIGEHMPPLAGVIHCAGVIEDALIANLTREGFDRVVRPKVLGAYHLDRLTRGHKLDLFVVYSSAVTLIGNPGQASYVAANLYVESLIRHRRAAGLTGVAVLWGAIADVGHLARNVDLARSMKDRLGVVPIEAARALDSMERALLADVAEVAVAELDWTKLSRLPQIAEAPKYASLIERTYSPETQDATDSDLLRQLASLPTEQAAQAMVPLLLKQVAEVMRLPLAKLEPDRSLIETGMDSLMMSELQSILDRRFGISISLLDLMDRATINGICGRIAEEIAATAETKQPRLESRDIDVDSLREDELDALIGDLMERPPEGASPGPAL